MNKISKIEKQLAIPAASTTASSSDKPIEQIRNRQTQEIIIGLCGPLGSGTSNVGKRIAKEFKAHGYDVVTLKISDIIAQQCLRDGTDIPNTDKAKRTEIYQEKGNLLRKNYGHDILAQIAITKIAIQRRKEAEKGDKHETSEEHATDHDRLVRRSRRNITIIDSLKHPAEVQLFRHVYGNMFYLFGVFCSDQQRKHRLMTNKHFRESDAAKLMERDQSEDLPHGQKLIKTLQLSDFFIRNNKQNIKSLEKPIKRFSQLILGKPDITPTKHEYAMYIAESAARRSGCLSRKVGASILNEDGNIIATGCNDVPKFGGGLYSTDDDSNDNRCFNWFDHSCQNNRYKTIISEELAEIIKANLPQDKYDSHTIEEVVRKIGEYPRIKNLLEFSRSVHAEMDAIISVARDGKGALKGSRLYTTTFPCHHCARHIVAAGIKKVYYIEPYEKSMAMPLHDDSISFEPAETDASPNKVLFLHFEGVAPRKYLDLFHNFDRKKDGKLVDVDLENASPIIMQLLDTFVEYESKIATYTSRNTPGLVSEVTP